MPYETTSDLPSQTDSLGKKQKRAFKQAFNSAVYDQGKDEKTAFKIAWSAAKKVGEGEETSKHASLQKHLMSKAYSVAKEKGYDQQTSATLALFVAKQADSGKADELAKHLKGKHDQKTHGSKSRELTSQYKGWASIALNFAPVPVAGQVASEVLSSSDFMSRKKKREIIGQVQGNSLDDTFEKANEWLNDRLKQGDQIEFSFTMNDDGKIQGMKMGGESATEVADSKESFLQKAGILGGAKGQHITHLHPFGTESRKQGVAPLSDADVVMATTSQAKSITATTPKGRTTLSFEWPEKYKDRRKFAKSVLKATDDYATQLNTTLEESQFGNMDDMSFKDRIKTVWRGVQSSKKESIPDKKRRATDVSRKADKIAQDVFGGVDGVTYTSTLDLDKE